MSVSGSRTAYVGLNQNKLLLIVSLSLSGDLLITRKNVKYHQMYPLSSNVKWAYQSWVFIAVQLHTNTSAHISGWVGVALVTLAAEGAVCVLTEAVAPTDGFIEAFVNICKAREKCTTLIFTMSLHHNRRSNSVNMVPLSQSKLPFWPHNNNRNHCHHNMSEIMYRLDNSLRGFSNFVVWNSGSLCDT